MPTVRLELAQRRRGRRPRAWPFALMLALVLLALALLAWRMLGSGDPDSGRTSSQGHTLRAAPATGAAPGQRVAGRVRVPARTGQQPRLRTVRRLSVYAHDRVGISARASATIRHGSTCPTAGARAWT